MRLNKLAAFVSLGREMRQRVLRALIIGLVFGLAVSSLPGGAVANIAADFFARQGSVKSSR